MNISNFPALLQQFFTDRLIAQQGASPHTVAGYRDTFRLLLQFANHRLGRPPSALRLEELDAEFLETFLEHLEHDRGNRPRTRNHRLSALHAFFRYVSLAEPAFSMQCQRILAIPTKRFERKPVEFLTEEETNALMSIPNTQTWIGRRDRALLMVAVQTGLRNSELTSLCCQDVELGLALTSAAWAKAERCAVPLCVQMLPLFSRLGCLNSMVNQRIQFFPAHAVGHSVPTPSSD